MEWYPWLNTIYFQILDSYKVQKGHHFVLIQSKKDHGEDVLVYSLSCWLMCLNPFEDKNCDQCRSCYLMKSHCHPDYYPLVPEKNCQSIGVEKVRILIESLYQYAHISNVKIVYVKNSVWLTEEAVNALLKVFEEPPNGVYFFLGCRNLSLLLPTLLSRCICLVFSCPEEKVSVSWLYKSRGIINNNLEVITALRLSEGFPLDASIILKTDYWKLRLSLCEELKKSVNNGDFLNILIFLKNHECEDKILISWVCTFLIDSLKYHYCVYDFLVNLDQIDLIRDLSLKFSLLTLNNQLQQWLLCLRYWEEIPHINQKFLFAYQLLNIEGNVMNFTC